MARSVKKWLRFVSLAFLALLVARSVPAATVTEALTLKPIQDHVDYDIPDAAAAKKCTLTAVKAKPMTGWEMRDGDGNVLRRFLDTNGDKRLDQWSYFKDGIEVYRDIDSDFNKKADQYRWLGTAGTRWAVDKNEDGRIDYWKVISPEEVSEEVIEALRTRDPARFRRLLLTAAELRSLRLGKEQAAQLARKIQQAAGDFERMMGRQKFVDKQTQWVNFGGTRPGIVPAGTDGSQRDLQVYENAAAIIESNGTHTQVIIGTLVRAADVWRVIDLPKSMSDAQASTTPDGFFFQASLARRAEADVPVTGGLSPEIQQLISEMEQIDKDLALATTPAALAPLNAKRADVLQKLADKATNDEDRATWVRQLADTISVAVQTGGYPDGIARLDGLTKRLAEQKRPIDLVAYVKFRYITAEYGQSLQPADADFAKIQQKWIDDLDQFVEDYPTTNDAAEAMLQLAMAEEFAGGDDKAVKWYERITKDFPSMPVAKKAAGAKRRIESVGKPLSLEGKDTHGNTVKLDAFRGKVVVIHYWATWCEPCKQDIYALKAMQTKYGKENVALIGINVDSARGDMDAFIKENPMPWPQLFELGGLDSPLANALGILTLPTMILVDKTGKVVRRNLDSGEIDTELGKLLR